MTDDAPERRSPRYLVGFVPTDCGEDAVALGALLSSSCGTEAELTICTVIPQTATGGDASSGAVGYGNLVAKRLEPIYERIRADLAPRTVTFAVRLASSAATGLVEYAAEIDADTLVLGSAGSGVMGRYAIGSVGGLLQHLAPISLALAPEGFAEAGVRRVSRVVCGCNVTSGSPAALGAAIEMCRTYAVPLHLVNFVFSEYPSLRHMVGRRALRDDPQEAKAAAEHMLAEVAAGVPDDVEVVTSVRSGGNVAQAVARAEWQDGDLLVLGSTRLGPVASVFLGSTSLKLLRACPVPVVAVPRPPAPPATPTMEAAADDTT